MASDLNLYREKGASDFLLEESIRNVVGTPIIAVRKSGTNNQRAGIITLTFTAVTPGASATCHITPDDPHNPSKNTGGVAVTLDGSTWHANIVEGLEFQFSSSGSFTSAWTGDVFYGAFWDTSDSSENSILNFGVLEAGLMSAAWRIRCQNDGADDAAECTVQALNGVRWVKGVGESFVTIDYTTVEQAADFAGIAITFANKNTTPDPDEVDILVNGNNDDVKNVGTGVVYNGGAAVPMDGVTVLEFLEGDLQGLRFVLSASVADTSTATVYVSDASRLVELAPDVSGSPGTYQAGTTQLTLTEDGGATTGLIQSGNAAFFWVRLSSLGTDSPVGNQRFARLLTRGLGL